MEQMLQTILEEVKGVKQEVRETKTELREEMQDMKTELREEMQDMKTELRSEMQEMKTELREEMDSKNDKQTEEIANELRNIVIFLEQRDNKIEKKLDQALEIQTEMLKDIRSMRKEYDYRISKLEYGQEKIEEKLLKIG